MSDPEPPDVKDHRHSGYNVSALAASIIAVAFALVVSGMITGAVNARLDQYKVYICAQAIANHQLTASLPVDCKTTKEYGAALQSLEDKLREKP